MLLGVLRGGLILAGLEILRAGLYVGLGSFGRDAANCVFNGSFGNGGGGMTRGPDGRLEE